MNDARDRTAIDDERRRNRPARIARDEGARAVDRINDEEHAAGKAPGVVGRLLGQPARLGERLAEPSPEQRIGGEIGLVTGEPPTFVSICAEVAPPGRKTQAPAPASRAASARRSRAARALISAPTFKAMSGA